MSKQVKGKKIIAVLPAYNAEKTLKKTLDDLPTDWLDDIILVDDASLDGTAELAKNLGLKTFVHNKNSGYGANQKTCYKKALEYGADIVIMVHPDHQYDPKLIPELIQKFSEGKADAVFGSRMMIPKNAIIGGMPYWKFMANFVLTVIENFVLGLNLTEYHSGFRAYSKKTLELIPFTENSDNFVFDSEIIVQMKKAGLKIQEIPIPTRYFPEASMIGFLKSSVYGLSILWVMLKFLFWKIKIIKIL